MKRASIRVQEPTPELIEKIHRARVAISQQKPRYLKCPYLEYVCVNEIGDLIKPHYVTESFPKLLKAKGMRQIRYHDLRHSCASLLLANGVPMKQIQEWLGHSDFSTTANIYAHLDYSSKLTSADAMLNGLGFAQN